MLSQEFSSYCLETERDYSCFKGGLSYAVVIEQFFDLYCVSNYDCFLKAMLGLCEFTEAQK